MTTGERGGLRTSGLQRGMADGVGAAGGGARVSPTTPPPQMRHVPNYPIPDVLTATSALTCPVPHLASPPPHLALPPPLPPCRLPHPPGLHVVCDVYCSKCMWPVGWKYVSRCPGVRACGRGHRMHAWRRVRADEAGPAQLPPPPAQSPPPPLPTTHLPPTSPPPQELAYEKSQKYKEGKVILERACVVDINTASSSSDDDEMQDQIGQEGAETDSDDY